jgi:predicted amidohydrolase YtcJ
MNPNKGQPRVLLINGNVYSARTVPRPGSALAIQGGLIIAVGGDADILGYKTSGTQVHDLAGRFVLPGFTDAHIHLEKYSLNLDQLDCETATLDECLERIKDKAQSMASGAWIRGHGWNQNLWGEYGNAEQLDQVSPENPVYLSAKSLHAGWANSLAMRLCNIDLKTADPARGQIQRNPSGDPTGIFFEDAVQLITSHIPHPSDRDLIAALRLGQEELLRYGITAVHDFDGARCLNALQALRAEGKLILRVLKHIREDSFEAMIEAGIASGLGDTQLKIGNLKLFADGALGPQTAAMLEPYSNSDSGLGMLTENTQSVLEKGRRAAQAGIGLAVHAIGDRANREVLDALETLLAERATAKLPPLPYRLEHLQLMHPVDIPRPGRLGVIASMQPIHAPSDMQMAERYWGSRVKSSYAWKSQLKAGAQLIFGSDAPVESPDPFLGLHAAVTRQRPDGGPGPDGWVPEERLTLDEALAAYTLGPQLAAGWGDVLGTLQPGCIADLSILPDDLRHLPSSDLPGMLPEAVMVGGQWVKEPDW